jgi:N-ethylmaleimide reductase
MSSPNLFSPLQLGQCALSHRVVMAPLTRMRATQPGSSANALMAQYYAQRASPGGFIIAEASQIAVGSSVSLTTPGSYSREQVAGWKLTTDAVHAKGATIFLQLWHVGRLSTAEMQADGRPPIAPSAIAAQGKGVPRALETTEIPALIQSYVQAARNALEAGFDGVEIHSANGYLLEQFLQSRSNQRSDQYGGSIENRSRLVLEVVRAVVQACGAQRVGIRLSPYGRANDSGEADPMPLYSYLIGQLDTMGLAYLHLIEPRASGAGQAEVDHQNVPSAAQLFRKAWRGVLIAAGNFRADSANAMIAADYADAIAFGRLFISNPDLPQRLRTNATLTPYNRATFYGGGVEGYLDYPLIDQQNNLKS